MKQYGSNMVAVSFDPVDVAYDGSGGRWGTPVLHRPPVDHPGAFFDEESSLGDFYILPSTRVRQESWTRTIGIDDADFYLRNLAVLADDGSVSVTFDTTRPVEAALFYRRFGTSSWMTYWSGVTSLEHTLKVNELGRGWYEFSICMMDENGNLIIDDGGRGTHTFTIGDAEGSFIEDLTIMERDGVTIEWRTGMLLRSTVYLREKGDDDFLSMDPGAFPLPMSHDHLLHLDLDPGEYEFFIASADGDGTRYVDQNGGTYYSITVEGSTRQTVESRSAGSGVYLTALGGILALVFLFGLSVWRSEKEVLTDISSVDALDHHIHHCVSDPRVTSLLILRLLTRTSVGEPRVRPG
jgi:hypothetical protein